MRNGDCGLQIADLGIRELGNSLNALSAKVAKEREVKILEKFIIIASLKRTIYIPIKTSCCFAHLVDMIFYIVAESRSHA